MKKAIVLLSAGLDSTVNLYAAFSKKNELKLEMALTFNYGQRSAEREIACSQRLCANLGVSHKVIEIPFVAEFGKSALLNEKMDLPKFQETAASDLNYLNDLDNIEISKKTAKAVWVPNRNGIMMNIAAGFAEALDIDIVIPGFNSEEAVTFPDNSKAYLEQLTECFSFSTANHVRAHCFTIDMNKTEIVAYGKALALPWHLIWPCYHSYEKWCGDCESCQRAKRALLGNAVDISGLFLETSK